MSLAIDLTIFISILAGLLYIFIGWKWWRARDTAIGFCAQCGKAIEEGDRCVARPMPGDPAGLSLFCSMECEKGWYLDQLKAALDKL